MKFKQRSQVNIAIPEQTVSAMRQPPFNITYKEKLNAGHYSQVIPTFWVELHLVAPNRVLDQFSTVSLLPCISHLKMTTLLV